MIYIVCISEQHYFPIFFTRLESVGTSMIPATQNPKISRTHVYKYITKRPNGISVFLSPE